jgi:glycosyltransferase 2 family protein
MKKALTLILKLLITTGLFWLLFRNLGFSNVMGRILTADPYYFLLSAAIFFFSMLLSAIQWDILLKHQGVQLGLKHAFNLYMIGNFFNNFLPGALGGDVVKVYRLRQDIRRGKEALAATFLDRFAGLFMLSIFALLSALYLHFFASLHITHHLYRGIIVLFGLFFVSLFMLFSRHLSSLLYDVILKNINPFGLRDKVKDLHNFLHLYRGNRVLYLKILLLSTVTQFLRILVHFLVARAVGFNVDFIYFLIFVPLIALAASLPVSFGGLGVREGLGKVLFSYVSPDGALAVATQFLASIVGILVSIAGGVIFILQKQRLPEEGNPEP